MFGHAPHPPRDAGWLSCNSESVSFSSRCEICYRWARRNWPRSDRLRGSLGFLSLFEFFVAFEPFVASVILILKSSATEEQIEHVLERVEALGLQHHLSRGTHRTIVGIIGDEEQLREDSLLAIPGVASVVPVLPAYKLASRDAHPDASVINVSGVQVGGGHLGMIAGPCSVEDRDRMFRIAEAVRESGANLFRGGAPTNLARVHTPTRGWVLRV